LIAGTLAPSFLMAAAPSAPAASAAAAPEQLESANARGQQAFRATRYAEASRLFEQVAEQADASPKQRAVALYELGRAQIRLHDARAAQETLKRSLSLSNAFDAPGRALLFNLVEFELAEAHRELGEQAAAREGYARALQGFQAQGDLTRQGDAHAGIGSTYLAESHFPEALDEYNQAIDLMDKSSSMSVVAVPELGPLQLNTASLMVSLGRYDQARALLESAGRRCMGKAPASCSAYVNHGQSVLAYAQAAYAVSADAASRAAKEFGPEHPLDQAKAWNNMGIALVKLHRSKEALPILQGAIAVESRNGADVRDLAAAFDSQGSAWHSIGDDDRARASYARALQTWMQLGDREGARDTLANLGELAADARHSASAIMFYKLSVNTAQSLRADASRLDAPIRSSLAKRVAPAYRKLAALLVDTGRLAEANQVTRMLKEDERYELVRGGPAGGTTATLAGPEIQEATRYDDLSSNQFAMARELYDLNNQKRDLMPPEVARRDDLEAKLASSHKEIEAFIDEVTRTLKSNQRIEPPPLSVRTLEGIQRSLRDLRHGAVLLRYVVLDTDRNALRIILVSPDMHGVKGYSVPVSAAELNHAVQAFREAIDARDPSVIVDAKRLYDWLFPPDLRQGLVGARAGTLMLSLDGVLRYVPFAALHDGHGWLVESHPVALYDEEAGASRLQHPPSQDWSVQAFGMTKAVVGPPALRALSGVRTELEAIYRDGGQNDHKPLYDDDFTTDGLRKALAKPALPVLHIASHFVLRTGVGDSFLQLGQGTLTLDDLVNNWDFSSIELLTLSACETAVSAGVDTSGRELESFASLAQKNGADAVLATLWPVYDPSTAAFMSQFYVALRTGRGGSERTKAEAMRQVQMAMLRGQLDASSSASAPAASGTATAADRGTVQARRAIAASAKYSHPYYWAPFVLSGNWN
jgi:CHAT domain-containing protein